jgi:hypothetical protein
MTNPYALDEHLDGLGLPSDMMKRKARRSLVVTRLIEGMDEQINEHNRRFIPGLLMAFVAMAEDATKRLGRKQIKDVLNEFGCERVNSRGQQVNTLNLILDDENTVRLRPFYNAAEHVFIHSLRRYDYPNMAPHATQAWSQHREMLSTVFAVSPVERRAIAEAVWNRVLELPEHLRRSAEDASPRPFALLLDEGEFPGTQKSEPPGAILQGLAFAYYRADSPNVTIETGKVGAGSRRTGRIGDVDGWNGPELVLSIEVKDDALGNSDDPTFDGFIANLGEWPDATAIVVAREASDDVVNALVDQNVSLLTRETMLNSVVRWDLNKQRLATREFHYFLVRVQRHSGLIKRFETFLGDHAIDL